ncbi:MAG: hypothetical protein JSS86_08485, partial [Cyanobacteria bacterium SZAS LIN-2]|nr:hypothetical protein [Cyanobacteria bacterium SZAS LIN-2]
MDTAIKEATDTPSQAEQIGGLIDRFEQTSAFAAGPLPARATSSIDTRAMVNSGALPAIDIDTQAAACETTYTRADWEREQLSLSKSLARADEILADGDIKSFKRFFADPNLSPTVREKFMEQNGERKIEQTFGNDSIMFSSDTEVQDALEYVKYGKNDVRTLIDRQSRFWGVDKGGVANALKSMSAEEQELFNSGKQMTLSQEPAITEEQAKAKEYYYAVHSALVKASGNNTWDSEQTDPGEVERWEQLIKGQSTQASTPLDVCDLQKTAVRAG